MTCFEAVYKVNHYLDITDLYISAKSLYEQPSTAPSTTVAPTPSLQHSNSTNSLPLSTQSTTSIQGVPHSSSTTSLPAAPVVSNPQSPILSQNNQPIQKS